MLINQTEIFTDSGFRLDKGFSTIHANACGDDGDDRDDANACGDDGDDHDGSGNNHNDHQLDVAVPLQTHLSVTHYRWTDLLVTQDWQFDMA
jgi:hypothetical protein